VTKRLDYIETAPNGVKALGGVYAYVMQSGLPPSWWSLSICAYRG
jgi:hypothetical protein